MNRQLLSSVYDVFDVTDHPSDECTNDYSHSLSSEVSHHDSDEAFTHVYYVMLFVASLWFVGKLFQRVGMPALVGEIIMGIIMGPNALNIVGTHGSEFLIIIGEVGLIMLVVEAGIDVDIGMLKLIGPRGLAIAVLGSIVPIAIGMIIATGFGETLQSSIAIGSCFAPTSMGIALNVLKKAKILNTPTGQLIIAAAILDDVIALIILSELTAMKHPTAKNILLPLFVSPILILVIGYLAIRYIPRLIKRIMSKIPAEHHENSILALLFVSTFILVPSAHFVGSSHLLGAFLSGLMFCTDHTIHLVWAHQIKRILLWMLRIFFACTIGFAIPIQQFGSAKIISRGLMYCLCAFGKIVTGLFGRPLCKKELFTVGFSMSAWGEFAFILATASNEEGTINDEAFSSVLLAVLLSVIISPYCLRLTLSYHERKANKRMEAFAQKYEDTNLHPLYLAINTKARGQWGHQDKILHKIFKLSLEIIDFRSWHAPEYNHSHDKPLTKESFYVVDRNLLLPPTRHIHQDEKQKLKDRVKQIQTALKSLLGDKAVVSIKRWLPGVFQEEDVMDKSTLILGERVPTVRKRPSYCRREAFKQAHSIMSSLDWDYENGQSILGQRMDDSDVEDIIARDNTARNRGRTISDDGMRKPLPKLPDLTQLQETQSLPQSIANSPKMSALNKTKSARKVHFSKVKLVRQLSEPKFMRMHSGAGHGGQAKGVGALPFTNDMINIHDHFEESNDESNTHLSEDEQIDDSTSYIYGDEDAHHHKLPQYATPVSSRTPSLLLQNMRNQINQMQKRPSTINEEQDIDHNGTVENKDSVRVKYSVEIDINGDPLEESYDHDIPTPRTPLTPNIQDNPYNNDHESVAITVTTLDKYIQQSYHSYGNDDNNDNDNNSDDNHMDHIITPNQEKIPIPSASPSPAMSVN